MVATFYNTLGAMFLEAHRKWFTVSVYWQCEMFAQICYRTPKLALLFYNVQIQKEVNMISELQWPVLTQCCLHFYSHLQSKRLKVSHL